MSALARARNVVEIAKGLADLNARTDHGLEGRIKVRLSLDDLAELVALAEAADKWSRTTHGTDAETDAAIPLLWHTAKVTGELDEAAAEVMK